MRVPKREECLKILGEHNLPQHIIDHCLKVAEISLDVCSKLASKGIDVDTQIVLAGALLHDIAKLSDGDHMREGAAILRELDFPRVADVVERHGIRSLSDDNLPQTLEDKIVYYCDKRVVNDRVVSLEERFDYLAKTYPDCFKPRGPIYEYTKNIERELLSGALLSRDDCINLLKEYTVPQKVIDHSIKVCEHSLELASAIESRGRKVNRPLLVAGALLHDIGKYCEGGPHEGAELLRKIGLPKVADIAERHAVSDLAENDNKPQSLEEKIVHYTDKCVIGDRDASIEARFDDLAERHPDRFTPRGRAYLYAKDLEREFRSSLFMQ